MDSGPKQRVAVELAVVAAALAVEEEACLVHPWLRRQPWDSNLSCLSLEQE